MPHRFSLKSARIGMREGQMNVRMKKEKVCFKGQFLLGSLTFQEGRILAKKTHVNAKGRVLNAESFQNQIN